MSQVIHPKKSYQIMGACFNVYNLMGCGFLESVYHECLTIEFEHMHIPYESKPIIELFYRDKKLDKTFEPDFLCFDQIIVEIKAKSQSLEQDHAQVLNYLNATKLKLGILVNFGHFPNLEYKRIAFTGAK